MPKRGGRNTRQIRQALTAETRAYKDATHASGSRYDGSHGHRAADGSWRTFVVTGRLRATEPNLSLDGAHNAIVHRAEHPISTEVIINPFDLFFAKK